MSLPTFPDSGLDISEDQALNMILASIAMEELALSHIMNAEGEKLQYILGTLPGKHSPCPSAAELLEVNRSVANLLDIVMNNQLLLKGKLDRVLEAKRASCPEPAPPCPHSCPAPPMADTLRLVQASSNYTWRCESRFPWKEENSWCPGSGQEQCRCQRASLSGQDPSVILLAPNQSFSIHLAFRFQNYETSAVALSVDLMEDCGSRQICCTECRGRSLTGQTFLTTPGKHFSRLCVTLHCPDWVCAENASLMIVPMDCR